LVLGTPTNHGRLVGPFQNIYLYVYMRVCGQPFIAAAFFLFSYIYIPNSTHFRNPKRLDGVVPTKAKSGRHYGTAVKLSHICCDCAWNFTLSLVAVLFL
jgi:hypothetical protein